MPIYEYRCDACGQSEEAMQKMSDAPLKLCASCGQEALQRVMSRTSFVLKGSGWYATDYKSTSSSTKTESSASESKPSVEAKPSSDTKAT
ncbi:MAG: zinc ribbon domain-containing protein [Deltaproteobacteria bacterium]|nr:zinc ribbon domain-containing protein [Deltaproteobacteria bacterium]